MYHQKLAKNLDTQFLSERTAIETEITMLQAKLEAVKVQIKELGFVGNQSKEFFDRHSEIKGEIYALTKQNQAYLTLTDLQEAKAAEDEILKKVLRTSFME